MKLLSWLFGGGGNSYGATQTTDPNAPNYVNPRNQGGRYVCTGQCTPSRGWEFTGGEEYGASPVQQPARRDYRIPVEMPAPARKSEVEARRR